MNRNDVTELIVQAKVARGIKWEDVAAKAGLSKEWVTAGCLGHVAPAGGIERAQDGTRHARGPKSLGIAPPACGRS